MLTAALVAGLCAIDNCAQKQAARTARIFHDFMVVLLWLKNYGTYPFVIDSRQAKNISLNRWISLSGNHRHSLLAFGCLQLLVRLGGEPLFDSFLENSKEPLHVGKRRLGIVVVIH
jgi:hypothetical protein